VAITARTATKGTAASGAAFSITFPTGSAAGDVIVLFVANAGTAGPAAPTGWTRYRNADSAGTGQSITTFTAPWSAGLTASFTNAASVAAWTCNAYSGSNSVVMTDGAGAASSATTNNANIPVGNPTTGSIAGDYEVLGYAWTSGATITAASGSTIDATQANGTAISCALGHNNTTSFNASTAASLGNGTLSASNTRKTGVGLFVQARNDQNPQPTAASLTTSRARARASRPSAVAPSAASLTSTLSTPTAAVTNNVSVSPSAGSLTTSASSPTIALPVGVAPSAGSLASSGSTPVLGTGLSPSAGALSATGSAPAIRLDMLPQPSAGSLSTSLSTPSVLTPVVVHPSAPSSILAGATSPVSVTDNKILEPSDPTLALSPVAPGVSVGANKVATPSAASLTTSASTPSIAVTEHIRLTPDATALLFSRPAPTVSVTAHKRVTPGSLALHLVGAAPAQEEEDDLAWVTMPLRAQAPVYPTPTPGRIAMRMAVPMVVVIDDADLMRILEARFSS